MSVSSSEAAILDQINSVVGRIDSKTAELQNSINGKLHWLPGGLQDNVVSGWNSFCGFMKRIWDNLNEILSNTSARLRAAGAHAADGDRGQAVTDAA